MSASPDRAETLKSLDQLIAARRLTEADNAISACLETSPEDAALWLRRGIVRAQARRLEDALQALEKSASIGGETAVLHYNMSGVKSDLGRLDQASDHLEQALRLNPKFYKAYSAYAHSRRFDAKQSQDWLNRVSSLLSQPGLQMDAAAVLNFAAARWAESAKLYDRAWDHAVAANTARQKPFDRAAWENRYQATLQTFTPGLLADASQGAGGEGSEFIFVVGMPRSGTTLTEQLLVSAGAFGAGERNDIQAIIGSLERTLRMPWPVMANRLDQETLRQAGAAYARTLKNLAPSHRVFVDKCPTNFRYLGFIRMILPGARFIWCRRDPMDTCLSCYLQDFNDQPYAFNLDSLAFTYAWQEKLMRRWGQVAGPVLEWRYEDALRDLEVQSQRLAEFAGLPWSPDILNFQDNERAVSTASNWQVRQPLYQSSRGRAARFGGALQPLSAALAAEGVMLK